MKKNSILILTDHSGHSKENALYDLAVKMHLSERTSQVDIASRGNKINDDFFGCGRHAAIHGCTIDEGLAYAAEDHPLGKELRLVDKTSYDLIWLRLPPPLSLEFLKYLKEVFPEQIIVNDPLAIYETGSKEFLLNFPSVCPPMRLCNSVEDISNFAQEFPIVLKPFREYGGKGLVRIDRDIAYVGQQKMSVDEFLESLHNNEVEYLGVRFLKNVDQGDKRIIVVNGEVMGASLRLPASGSWICNVAMGGTSHYADITEEEYQIIKTVDPVLNKMGIVMYGIDTLVGDDGKRVLSELNTTSIGGLPQISRLLGEPLVEKAIDLIWDYYEEKIKENG